MEAKTGRKAHLIENSENVRHRFGVFMFKMQNIRRRIITDIAGSPQKQKAVALALLLKEKTNDSSVIRRYSVYKVQKMTGMAYKTIRKYIDVLRKMGLAEIREGDLYIKRMSSPSKHRNICIANFRIDKTKNVFNQLRELLFLIVQAHKDFIHSLLRLRKDPQKGTDFKKVRRLCKKCCGNPDAGYREMGLSYNCIARKVGCCARTAFTLVKDAVRRKWCAKHNRCSIDYLPGVNCREIPGYTFTSFNYGFIVRPNTYTLSPQWKRVLGADADAATRAGGRK